ncbi:MAG: SCO family protein [Niabella sp.]
MSKKGLYAVLMAVLLPLTCYLVIRHYSDEALSMPRYYMPDSINARLENGKRVTDTVWHRLPDFKLVNQVGEPVRLSDYEGKIIILDFFFTHCPTICPALTANMRTVEEAITNAQRVGDKTNHNVHFLSFSVDPERDSVPQLKKWADRFQVNPEQWDLLTGDKKTIYDLALNDLRLAVVDGKGVDTSFVHTDLFVLLDGRHHIRGYYHGLEDKDLKRLSRDAVLLTLEKDKTKKSGLPVKALAIAFLITAVAVGLFMILFKKKKDVDYHLEEK